MFHAVFLITLGLVLLSNNFQILPWSIWRNLLPFWPILIVFAGIDAIFGRSFVGRLLASLINSVIFLAIIARVVGYDLDILKIIPLPRRDNPEMELFYTNKDGIDQRFYFGNGRKGTF